MAAGGAIEEIADGGVSRDGIDTEQGLAAGAGVRLVCAARGRREVRDCRIRNRRSPLSLGGLALQRSQLRLEPQPSPAFLLPPSLLFVPLALGFLASTHLRIPLSLGLEAAL